MVNTQGLALDQTPPIHVPFRYFLIAPLFAAGAGLLLAFDGSTLLKSRWYPGTLALTHLITLGFLAQIMIGAMMQLLPILTGASLWRVVGVSGIVQVLLVTGTGLLAVGFRSGGAVWLLAGGGMLFSAFALFLSVTGLALLQARGAPGTLAAMRLGWTALLPTVVLGLLLVLVLADRTRVDDFQSRVDLHLAWGLLGWVGLHLVGIASELVPMFYMTPRPWSRMLLVFVVIVFVSLLGLSWSSEPGTAVWDISMISASMAFLCAALVVLWLTKRRKRPIFDTTLIYIWTGCGALIGAVCAWAVSGDPILVGILLLGGVALAFPTGMLYKIVPFLCWFHLQRAQLATGCFGRPVPQMKAFIPERQARWQLYSYLMAFGFLLLGHYWPEPASHLGGALLTMSSLLLFANLLSAVRRYRRELVAIEQS